MDPNTRWRLVASDAHVRREWDGESIVYDERSGATHLLGKGATALLHALEAAPAGLTTTTLVQLAFPAQPIDEELWPLVEAAVLSLERSGLIQSSPP